MKSDALRVSDAEKRVEWLAEAAARLLDDVRMAPEALSESTGLSVPMVVWGARTTLETMREEALASLAADARAAGGNPISSLSVVLAGNVFTAAARAIVVPLLLGIPVVAKASSRERLFPTLLRDALHEVDAELGMGMDVVTFSREALEHESALIDASETTAVYGSDETIEAIRARHPDARILQHGHGVSVGYCGSESLRDDRIGRTIASVALDVCAYDQRGCLSPQILYVEEGGPCSPREFAERLAAEGLDRLQNELPRGPLPLEVGAAQAQWRGLAEVEGALLAGDSYAIAVRPVEPVRFGPAYRNVTVAPVDGIASASIAMANLGSNLKCVGADPRSLPALERALGSCSSNHAYVCLHGTMQTPSLDAPADGRPVWHGLLR